MPRGKKDQYALAEDGNGGLTPVRVGGPSDGVSPVPSVPEPTALPVTAAEAMAWLMARTDGWLRAAPDKDGKTNHFKWKFNSQRWPNHYVYYSCPVGRWSEGLCGLALKVLEVDQGERKPTYDTYYNQQGLI